MTMNNLAPGGKAGADMSTPNVAPEDDRYPWLRKLFDGYRYLFIGGATGIASLLTGLAWLLVCIATVPKLGLAAWKPLADWTKRLTAHERERAGALLGEPVQGAFDPVTDGGRMYRFRLNFTSPGFRRTLAWLPAHGFAAPITLMLTAGHPWSTLWSVVLSVKWLFTDGGEPYSSSFFYTVDSAPLAITTIVLTLAVTAVIVAAVPWFARLQARLTKVLLSPLSSPRLAQRVVELTATRAAALEAHGAELRRIERDLHDGTQARMVAVVMQLGIAERSMHSDPTRALELIRQARDSATSSISELREVVRSIYPPILDDRGLDGAVSALAARCPIPCTVQVDDIRRAPAAVEAAAYFVIAESLTNAAKHSSANEVHVRLRTENGSLLIEISDDGKGGAEEGAGTGLMGIRRRAEAFDGRVHLSSPVGGPTTITTELPCES